MLFKHGDNKAVNPTPEPGKKEEKVPEVKPVSSAAGASPIVAEPVKDTSPAALRDLLEKNLKWSQIIYEQNRKIKNALVWKAIVSWLWFIVLVVLPALGSYYVYQNREAFAKKFSGEIQNLMVSGGTAPVDQEKLLQLLPLDPAQKEQLKSMLGPTSKSNQ